MKFIFFYALIFNIFCSELTNNQNDLFRLAQYANLTHLIKKSKNSDTEDLSAKDKNGKTILHYIFDRKEVEKFIIPEIIQTIVAKGAGSIICQEDKFGNIPLNYAIKKKPNSFEILAKFYEALIRNPQSAEESGRQGVYFWAHVACKTELNLKKLRDKKDLQSTLPIAHRSTKNM